MSRINWIPVVEEVKNALDTFFEPRGIKPSLRTMFYRLYSLGKLPNTVSAYKGLIKKLVEARKNGLIPFDAFSDGAKRSTIGSYDDIRIDPIEWAEKYIEKIKEILDGQTYNIGRWHNQPHYVEVWIEKDALASTFEKFLEHRDVYICVNKGYSSWTFLYDNAMRLQKMADKDKELHVLYFGDFDPSGLDMELGHLNDALEFFGLDIDFHRVSITLDQIQNFEIPEMPEDPDTVAKAHRDPRYKKFMEEHGRLVLVELDAMLAVAPDDFQRIVQESVDQYYDFDIWHDVQDLESEDEQKFKTYLSEHVVLK